ncbi:MAG: TonB-dependent receptor, partial [Rhizomicrobium sp.]
MYRSHLLLTAVAVALVIPIVLPARADSIETVTVTAAKLDAARLGIQPQLGASTYTIGAGAIDAQPGGDNNLLNQVVLQAPGVAQDSFGQLHVRGEHNG